MKRSNRLDRFVDRYIGCIFIAIIGLFHKKNKAPKIVRNIGFIQPTAIGDLVMASGLIKSFSRRIYKDTGILPKVILYVGETNYQATSFFYDPVETRVVNFKNIISSLRIMRADQIDILIDLTPWARVTAIISALSLSKYTIGFKAQKQFKHYSFDLVIPHSLQEHEAENLKRIYKDFFGDEVGYLKIGIRKPQALRIPDISKLLPTVALHPCAGGSRAREKAWPIMNWVELIRLLRQKNVQVVLLGSSNDILVCNKLFNFLSEEEKFGVKNLCGRLSLDEYVSLALISHTLVSVDTGTLHLASMCGAKVVGLYGPTSSKRWGSIGMHTKHLDGGTEQDKKIQFGFERCKAAKFAMTEITPERVLVRVREFGFF